jgi:hypothetical protein
VGFVLPHVQVEVDDLAGGTSGEDAGFTDFRAYLLWSPWAPDEPALAPFLSEQNLHFAVGLSLPTAEDRPSSPPVDRDGQLGSGSVDFRIGITYWGYLTPEWCAFASGSLIVDTGYDLAGYRNSPSYSLRAGAGWMPLPQLQLYASFRVNFSDKNFSEPEPDGIDADSGGTFWYFAPSVVVKPVDRLILDAALSLPLFHDVNGSQVLPGITIVFGISYLW